MKKIVSIALFGERAGDYSQFLRAYIRGHLNLFPLLDEWMLRVHVDSAVAKSEAGALVRRYAEAGLCESVLMYPNASTRTPPLCKAMLWRLAPVFDPGVDYVFSRDLDAPPMPRDVEVARQFMLSGAAVGTAHDNVAHTGVMGGLCHFRASEFRRLTGFSVLEDLYAWAGFSDERWARHGADQDALNRLLSERPQLTLLEHRFDGWRGGPGGEKPRGPGIYSCEAWSTRTPNDSYRVDWLEGRLSAADRDRADRLGAHLGCAGYNHEAAIVFWDAVGGRSIKAVIEGCEARS